MQGRLSPPYDNRTQHFPHKTWQNEFYNAKELNLNSIQWVYEFENFHLNPLYQDTDLIKKISSSTGIKINSVILDYFMESKLFNENDSIINKNFNHLDLIINQCIKANIKIIEIPFVDNSSLRQIKDLEIFKYNIKKILKKVENKNIFISFETDLDPKSFLDLIKSFEPYKIFINYDMGNSTSNNFNFEEEIKLLGLYIKNIHIKDRISNNGTTVPLGTGNTNFKNIFQKLININYQGEYILQCARKDINPIQEKSDPIETIKDYISFIQKLVV
jgi:hexulose-6-phosphate isomerase